MKKDRNKVVPAVYAIIKKDGKILLGRRQNTTYYDGWYGMPSGHVEVNEVPTQALIREIKEEIGVEVNTKDLKFAQALYRAAHDETGDRADYFFIVEKWSGEPKIMEPEKCDDLQWFLTNQLPENMIHHEKEVFVNIIRGVDYSEEDLEHVHKNPNTTLTKARRMGPQQ